VKEKHTQMHKKTQTIAYFTDGQVTNPHIRHLSANYPSNSDFAQKNITRIQLTIIPFVRCIERWWICFANFHQNATWIHVVVRWLHLCHLDQCYAWNKSLFVTSRALGLSKASGRGGRVTGQQLITFFTNCNFY